MAEHTDDSGAANDKGLFNRKLFIIPKKISQTHLASLKKIINIVLPFAGIYIEFIRPKITVWIEVWNEDQLMQKK